MLHSSCSCRLETASLCRLTCPSSKCFLLSSFLSATPLFTILHLARSHEGRRLQTALFYQLTRLFIKCSFPLLSSVRLLCSRSFTLQSPMKAVDVHLTPLLFTDMKEASLCRTFSKLCLRSHTRFFLSPSPEHMLAP